MEVVEFGKQLVFEFRDVELRCLCSTEQWPCTNKIHDTGRDYPVDHGT